MESAWRSPAGFDHGSNTVGTYGRGAGTAEPAATALPAVLAGKVREPTCATGGSGAAPAAAAAAEAPNRPSDT